MFLIVTGKETIKTGHWPDGRRPWNMPITSVWHVNEQRVLSSRAFLNKICFDLITPKVGFLIVLASSALVILPSLTRRFYYLEFARNVSTRRWNREISPTGHKSRAWPSTRSQPNTLFVCVSWIIGDACRRARLQLSHQQESVQINILARFTCSSVWPSDPLTRTRGRAPLKESRKESWEDFSRKSKSLSLCPFSDLFWDSGEAASQN